jgi:hypothetical protein
VFAAALLVIEYTAPGVDGGAADWAMALPVPTVAVRSSDAVRATVERAGVSARLVMCGIAATSVGASIADEAAAS